MHDALQKSETMHALLHLALAATTVQYHACAAESLCSLLKRCNIEAAAVTGQQY
jgi:hypothetical protein